MNRHATDIIVARVMFEVSGELYKILSPYDFLEKRIQKSTLKLSHTTLPILL